MLRVLIAASLAATLGGAVYADTSRVEIIPFTSTTLKDPEFLAGGQGGQTVTLAGELRLPKSTGGKVPAVVLLHGSGGLGGTGFFIDEWSKALNEQGIATFAVDSFAGRGIVSTTVDQAQLGRPIW